MFLPLLQSPASWTWLVVRSSRDPQQLAAAMRSVLRDIDPGMVLEIRPWSTELGGILFPSRMATVSLGVLGVMGAHAFDHRHLRNGGILGEQAAAGAGNSHGSRRASVRKSCRRLWDVRSNCWRLVRGLDWLWVCLRRRCWLSSCIRQRPAIRWSWPVSFWPCCCWDWWPRGFQRNARYRSIL